MEQFEQLLTCAICLDRYRNPKLLPCQHSFCMEPCMDGLVDYVRRQVKCPECRAEHRIPYQGVQAFPTNVTLQRFLELHIEITGELPDPTSGQVMERCSVCSEKSYCNVCAHCEKKCCPECKEEHIKILRKNIGSINSQVRRALHRLQEALAQVEKNTLALQTNAAAVNEEVDEIYRRLNKALKDRTDFLRNEIDRYLNTELRGLIHLKENLEQEIANIQSNCDLAEAHINENVPWDDNELLDTKELFLRTLEFIRNFEYEAGDYSRRMRFVMTHEPNQLVLHVAGYGELNIKPEAGLGLMGGTGAHHGGGVGSHGCASTGGGSNTPGLMRSKSDHRLASQYRQQDDDRTHGRNRYVPEYEYDTPEYEAPRSRSRYRSRFMRNRDGEDSDGGDQRSTSVRFNAPQESSALRERERVLDTEDASRGPLSGIYRLTDSPRVMKKLNDYERAGKRKKDEPAQQQQQQQAKTQIQPAQRNKGGLPASVVGRQVSEDDEISRIKRQNKTGSPPGRSTTTTTAASAAANATVTPSSPSRELPEERRSSLRQSPLTSSPLHARDLDHEDGSRKTPIPSRRTSTDVLSGHHQGTRSGSSESSASSESSTGSGIRGTGAHFTAEEMKQKYLSRAPHTNATGSSVNASNLSSSSLPSSRDSPVQVAPVTRPFQSRFLGAGNRTAPPPPQQQSTTSARDDIAAVKSGSVPKKSEEEEEEDDDEDTSSSSSEETESESEEDSEPEARTNSNNNSGSTAMQTQSRSSESAMARTDIGPLLARSAEARRGSKEDSPATTRYGTSRGSPAQSVLSPTSTTASSSPSGYTSRFLNKSRSQAALSSPGVGGGGSSTTTSSTTPSSLSSHPRSTDHYPHHSEPPEAVGGAPGSSSGSSSNQDSARNRYAALKDRRQRLARSRSSHNFGGDDADQDLEDPPSPTTQSPNAYLAAKYGAGSELARSRSSHALKSREASPDRERPGAEKDGAALSSWARYLKNKYGNRTAKDKEPPSTSSAVPSSRYTKY